MAARATMTFLGEVSPGNWQVRYDDGSVIGGTHDDLLAWMSDLYDDVDFAKRAALGKAYAQDPTLRNASQVLGRAVVLDPSHPNPVRVEAGQGGTGVESRVRNG